MPQRLLRRIKDRSFWAGVSFSSEAEKATSDGTTTESDPVVSFNLSPRAGYFIAQDLEAGLRLGYNSYKTGDIDGKTVSCEFFIWSIHQKIF